MEHIIDALNLAGFEYDVIGNLVIVKRWNGNGTLQICSDAVTGESVVTEVWDGQSQTDIYDTRTVEQWITDRVNL